MSEGYDVSIIVPALNEAENLPILAERIAAALPGRAYELIIVDDDSRDNTVAVCEQLAKSHPLRLMVRKNGKNGLSGAVLHGMAQASGRIFLVMDADLQHPPDRIPALLAPVEGSEADFALGSRYVKGGSTAGRWSLFRRINSYVATLLARPFAGAVRDPMSGFFCLRRETYERADRLTPLGYKIALELICKCRVQRVIEVPIHFSLREHGESKLTLKEQVRYLEHLSRLYDFVFPRLSPVLKFLIVLACTWSAAFLAYLPLTHVAGKIRALILAYPVAMIVNLLFHARYLRVQREFIPASHPWRDFFVIALAEWATCIAVANWLAWRAPNITVAEAFVWTFGCATVVRYVLRKELLQDIRGLRRDTRATEAMLAQNAVANPPAASVASDGKETHSSLSQQPA